MNKEVKQVVDYAATLGFAGLVELGSGHYRMRHKSGEEIIFPATPSKPSWRGNKLAEIHRIAGRPKKPAATYKRAAAVAGFKPSAARAENTRWRESSGDPVGAALEAIREIDKRIADCAPRKDFDLLLGLASERIRQADILRSNYHPVPGLPVPHEDNR